VPGASATIFAHEKGFSRISAPGSPALQPEKLWPTDTFFTRKKNLFFNHEPIEIRWTPALTDANVIVWFRGSDVIAAGDSFTTESYPRFDTARGGSIQGVLDALNEPRSRPTRARCSSRRSTRTLGRSSPR
jgi:glyoxylase-like metal-dependent hydrolase (beta-lactamase superfamily II)